MEDRRRVFKEVEEVLDHYCQGCFVKKHFRKEKGKTYAHQFCISECTVGAKLKELGNALKNN
ncbi:zinc-finger domain-containing protein [Bacillus massiliglaciei]|uniref:zinc-finger domain-containing protein n=1 Tax=Bacillus massiliglaciei TaxID=1816693 RepID=UPI000DA62573|nr:zinc-finger domain-containing protein [Bacillus massiliglaciei]